MELPEPVGSSAPLGGRADRPLGRGLEDVSRVFLSHGGEERLGPAGPAGRPLPRGEAAPGLLLLRPAASVTREQVAEALWEYTGALEEGLTPIDAGVPCGLYGEIDLLGLDRAQQLTVVDFEVAPSDGLMIRGLGHLEWIAGNVPALRRMFRGQAINFSQPPRLFLVAPGFSIQVRAAARRIATAQIAWIRYRCLETPGRAGISFEVLPAE